MDAKAVPNHRYKASEDQIWKTDQEKTPIIIFGYYLKTNGHFQAMNCE
jgi:hypothetical protein